MNCYFRPACLAILLIGIRAAYAEQPPLAEPVVQALQRTLNAKLNPSPKLEVDGKTGPATVAAIKEFQKSAQLEPTGELSAETYRELGPLQFTELPLPTPEEIQRETLTTEPGETLDGPPLVTCKAWAIADAKTGELLWSEKGNAKLSIASTTKMMTAYLVCRLAAADPKVLDEVVTVSAAADKTSGSTADVREGERLTVGELLYGLMLPSGNDASVALAEHFGSRAPGTPAETSGGDKETSDNEAGDKEEKSDPQATFVKAMNRQAKELGMADSDYSSPHGLTTTSSARDLLRLTFAARQNPLFRQYITIRQRGVTVTGTGGYLRNIVWKNTNELLRKPGYSGVKTGTTTAAGSCLVACGEYQGDELLVCVLGSTSNDARYVDSRNLFRWAWRERRAKAAGN